MRTPKPSISERFTTCLAWSVLALSLAQLVGLGAIPTPRAAHGLRGSLECSSDFHCEIRIAKDAGK